MSRRFSMTSNPVRASESQDEGRHEAEPLLGDAEEKCDVVVEAIGFGNWSLLLVILLGFLFMGIGKLGIRICMPFNIFFAHPDSAI